MNKSVKAAHRKICDNCRFYRSWPCELLGPLQINQGECRKRPPRLTKNPRYKRLPDDGYTSRFPPVSPFDWCGEWAPREPEEGD